MGYRISYVQEQEKRTSSLWFPLSALFLVLFVGFVYRFWPEGWEVFLEFLFPNSGEITGEALDILVSDLKGGESFHEAVTAFCRSILTDPS